MSTQLISIADAADLLAVSPKTVRRLIARGELPARKIGSHLVRIEADALAALGRPLQVRVGR